MLVGIMVLAPALAAVYGELGWRVACIVVACGLVIGAALVPPALRALGLPDALVPVPGTRRAGALHADQP